MAKVNMSEAIKLVPVGRTRFYKDKKEGKFTVEEDHLNRPVVDTSELLRVYGDLDHENLEESRGDKTSEPSQGKSERKRTNVNRAEIVLLQQMLDDTKAENAQRINDLKEHIEHLETSLEHERKNNNTFQVLIEDLRKKPEDKDLWKSAIDSLEKRIANNEKQLKDENERLRIELEASKSKEGFFSKLFKG